MRDPGYAPHTPADRARMLAAVGAATVEELFADIPEALRGAVINLPAGLEQQPLAERIDELAAKNRVERVSFLGAGAYRHWIPPVVDHL